MSWGGEVYNSAGSVVVSTGLPHGALPIYATTVSDVFGYQASNVTGTLNIPPGSANSLTVHAIQCVQDLGGVGLMYDAGYDAYVMWEDFYWLGLSGIFELTGRANFTEKINFTARKSRAFDFSYFFTGDNRMYTSYNAGVTSRFLVFGIQL